MRALCGVDWSPCISDFAVLLYLADTRKGCPIHLDASPHLKGGDAIFNLVFY